MQIYVEGGGDSKALRSECRRAFRELFSKAGLQGRLPRVIACGGRENAFADCRRGRRTSGGHETLLLVDSEGYGKGRHSFSILGRIDPAKVRLASPWAERLFATLERLAGET